MDDLAKELAVIVGQPESESLEYKAVLPPSRVIAQIICAFANSKGGYLVLGVTDKTTKVEVTGLSSDFQASAITHKASDLLTPHPNIIHGYFVHKNKKLYAIKVIKSDKTVFLEKKIYIRKGSQTIVSNPDVVTFASAGYARLKVLSQDLELANKTCTGSKQKVIEHYLSVLKIMDDLSGLLYPVSPQMPTQVIEGKILSRILFSSCVDNFETYLSDLLFEIYLAKPMTLKSKSEVTVEEVLNCSDIQDFVRYYAKQKLLKLQKGSVKGFIKDNKQISDLKVLSEGVQTVIEGILQIRHLYSHRNGIIDEKFILFFPTAKNNEEHSMSIEEISNKIEFLANIIFEIDSAAVTKYSLATI